MRSIGVHIFKTIMSVIVLCSAAACGTDDFGVMSDNKTGNGVAVNFTARYAATEPVSKATGGKTDFVKGDVIHIAARFYEGEMSSGDKGKQVGGPQYCAYKHDGNSWKPVSDRYDIKWPYSCDYGMFKAYHISHSNGAITETESSVWSLSEISEGGISDDTGPMGTEAEFFPFGHTVKLSFSHLCARLSIVDLDVSTMSEYWFSKPGDTGFHNAYKLVRDANEGLKLEWCSADDNEYGIYISRSLDKAVPSEYGNTITLYLQPGVSYSGSKLYYRYNRSYITLNSDKLNNLKANHSYVLDIKQDMGIVFEDTDDGGWTNPDTPDTAFELKDIPAFLKAAGTGQAYSEGETKILEKTSTGVVLLTDLNFSERDPLSENDFPESHLNSLENLTTTVTFDGNFKYIHNSVRPIFGDVQGRLYNLGVSNTVRSGKVDPAVDGYGGLARSVNTSGRIGNVRINNLSLTLELPYTEGADTYYIGCVAGFNNGIVSGISVRGNISINLHAEDAVKGINSEVLIGGIVGQNGGMLSDGSEFSQGDSDRVTTCITIKNTCSNKLAMSTGGIVGYSYGDVENMTLNVDVDASQSTASWNFTGGMAGRLRRSGGSQQVKYFKDITVEGSVKGGQGISKSFTGGIAGRLFNYFIDNCNAMCDVYGWNGEQSPGVRYAAGGAFGCIATSDVEELVHNSSWWGTRLEALPTGDNSFFGTFAGIIPPHRSEEVYKANGNRTRDVSGIGFFGDKFDDKSDDDTPANN